MINCLLIILSAISVVQGLGDRTTKAYPGEFNYFVMVWYRDKLRCGGTIIDQRHIITRGSCVVGIPSSNLSIIAGTIDTQTFKTRFQVESVHIHYGFKPIHDVVMLGEIHWVHDIAVLKLVNPMLWNLCTAPAMLITGDNNWNLVLDCVVPSWRQSFVGTSREHYYIRWIGGNIHIDEKCIELGVRLLENEKCAYWITISSKWTHAINYYSGSPIVHENVVIGIVDDRKRKRFHAFLNLAPYKDFIENALDDRKYDVHSGGIKYVVSVWYEGFFKCGGIILDASHILTTGDCVQYANQLNLQVIAGHTQVLKNDPQIQWLSVNNIEIHPDYEEIIHFDGPKFMHIKNNYAVLTLAVPLEWGPTIGPAFLTNAYFVPTNLVCGAYRWHNAYAVDDEILLQLVWSQEVIIDAEVRQEVRVDLVTDEIYANSQYGQHSRNLDSSGNPLVCEGFVIGIIIPKYSTVPQFSCLTSILSISPFLNTLNNECYIPPIY